MNLAFVVIAAVLFFSIDDPVLATLALAAALLTGEYSARRAAHWVNERADKNR